MSLTDDDRDLLDVLAEDFLERRRRGERPSLAEYEAKAPGQVDDLRDLLSALLMVEDLKPRPGESTDPDARSSGPTTDPESPEGPGLDRVGEFRILREVGRGGMGVVYEAVQESLGRRVALKVLALRQQGRGGDRVRRFVREARAAAQLHHANIVPIFGVGEADGLHYYAMQFIRGLGLDQVLEEVRRYRDRSEFRPLSAAAADEAPTRLATRSSPDADSTPLVGPGPGRLASEIAQSWVEGRLAAHPAGNFADTMDHLPGEPDADVEPQNNGREECDPDDEASPEAWRDEWADSEGSPLSAGRDTSHRYALGVARIGAQVAEALSYAHGRGILHRDIKPSNLLLDPRGTAWVTDFGLAKAAEDDDLTRTGDLVGTLRYMAPERFRGRCDARSDVYALGLTLYELLALRPAFEASGRDRLIYEVTQHDPPRLRSVAPHVPRDLATIVQKAIEKEPSDRYQNAAALASDLRRFLDDLPIAARPVSSGERVVRWSRRNPGTAALAATVLGLLVLIATGSSYMALSLKQRHEQALEYLGLARAAEADAKRRLWESALERARAIRRRPESGRRFEALAALSEASLLDVHLERRGELRDEVIASLALADLREARRRVASTGDSSLVAAPGDLAIAPDFQRVALTEPGGGIRIETLDDGAEIAQIPALVGLRPVLIRFGPESRTLAVKYEGDGRVELAAWVIDTARLLVQSPHGVPGSAFDFDPTGRSLASAQRDGSIAVHSLETGAQSLRLPPGAPAESLRIDPTGQRLAVSSLDADRSVEIRSLVEPNAAPVRVAIPGGVYALAWAPGGTQVAAGGVDGAIRLIDPEGHRPPRTLEGHQAAVVSLAIHPEGDLLASASWDGTLRLWDLDAGQELLRTPMSEAVPLSFSRDGRLLGLGRDRNEFWTWEVAAGSECLHLAEPGGSSRGTWGVAYHPKARLLASAGPRGVRLFAPGRGGAVGFIDLPGTAAAMFDSTGSALYTGGGAGLLRWPTSTGPQGQMRIGPPAPLPLAPGLPTTRFAIAPGDQRIAAVVDAERGRVAIFDLATGRQTLLEAAHPGVERLAFSPDGTRLATGTWRGTGVKVWDVENGRLVGSLPVAGSAEVVYSPDGHWLVSSSGREIRFWQADTLKPSHMLIRDKAGSLPGQLAFSPDAKLLAVTRTRDLIQLVDPITGRALASLEMPNPRHISGLGFSPDGRFLVATFNTEAVRVWDLHELRIALGELGLDYLMDIEMCPTPSKTADDATGRLVVHVEPPPWSKALQRGDAAAEAGRWSDAVVALAEARAAGATTPDVVLRLALAQLAAGDLEAYRQTCREAMSSRPDPTPPHMANTLAWTCVVGPAALDDLNQAVALAESAVASRSAPSRLNTLGGALLRAGRIDEALATLNRAVASDGSGGMAFDWVLMAVAARQRGDRKEVDRCLALADQPAPGAIRPPAEVTPWHARVALELLRREAMEDDTSQHTTSKTITNTVADQER